MGRQSSGVRGGGRSESAGGNDAFAQARVRMQTILGAQYKSITDSQLQKMTKLEVSNVRDELTSRLYALESMAEQSNAKWIQNDLQETRNVRQRVTNELDKRRNNKVTSGRIMGGGRSVRIERKSRKGRGNYTV